MASVAMANNGGTTPSDQIRQMVNFILQEAHEKANEIRVKVRNALIRLLCIYGMMLLRYVLLINSNARFAHCLYQPIHSVCILILYIIESTKRV
jgi:hypothetical protein